MNVAADTLVTLNQLSGCVKPLSATITFQTFCCSSVGRLLVQIHLRRKLKYKNKTDNQMSRIELFCMKLLLPGALQDRRNSMALLIRSAREFSMVSRPDLNQNCKNTLSGYQSYYLSVNVLPYFLQH